MAPSTALIITVEPQNPIPAISTWGVVVLGLLTLTVGTGVFGRLKIGRLKIEDWESKVEGRRPEADG